MNDSKLLITVEWIDLKIIDLPDNNCIAIQERSCYYYVPLQNHSWWYFYYRTHEDL